MKSSVLKVENLEKAFATPILKNISFELFKGETVALVGANGAGKSTLLKCLMGLIYPQKGNIVFFDQDGPASSIARERIGFLPELVGFWPEMTPFEILSLCFPKKTLKEKIKKILEEVGLAHRMHGRVGEFSKGMTQRLGLACLLLKNPSFLILDEPMTGLDFKAQEWLRQFLHDWRNKERTLLISTHSLRDVEYLADRVIVLDQGHLIKIGPKNDVLPDLYKSRDQVS
jgi:ABC-2 type transport system ATP-binding protein